MEDCASTRTLENKGRRNEGRCLEVGGVHVAGVVEGLLHASEVIGERRVEQ